jgi:hypothetical protein
MKMFLRLSLLSLCILSCKRDLTTQPSSSYLETWRSYEIHDYSVEQTRSCFCINGGEKIRLTVKSDTISSVIKISDGTALSFPESGYYMSIEQLFDFIKNSKDSLVIKYNDKYGYPEYLDIDPQLHPIDGGALYETANLSIIAEK